MRQQGISKGKRKDEASWFDDLLPSKQLQMRRLVMWHEKKNGEVKTNTTFKSSVYNPWTDVERQRNFCRLQKSKPYDLSQNSERSGYSVISGVADPQKSCQNADGDT